jgi:hypothetical protein
MAGTPDAFANHPHSARILRCLKCGKVTDCTPDDLLRYAQTKWPRCCKDVMTLFIQTPKPKLPPTA